MVPPHDIAIATDGKIKNSRVPNLPPANNFDILRLFAAILVLYGHSYALVNARGPSFAANGVHTIGLKIFFVVSGDLITRSWLNDPHAGRYL